MTSDYTALRALSWRPGAIDGCVIEPLRQYRDERGWLAEFFRHDDLASALHPVMGYVSMTMPGIARGPHEHVDQTDLFVFFHGAFRLYLWDARPGSSTYGVQTVVDVGASHPCRALVPPGVVHAYRNIGETDGLIVNCPNRLYAGEGKQHPVDEIRHEEIDDSPFVMD